METKLVGYNGKIAYINLSTKKIEIKDLDSQIAKDYIGGTGLSAKLIFDMLSKDDYNTIKGDIFNEINPVVFATGPITGTARPSSGRYSVSGISPLTHHWGEGTSGGFFCISLRKCGYDALVITGKAKEPTYLFIDNGKIEFKDASAIWGKDTYETQDVIIKELGITGVKVACIGIAGENLVKYACIMNDEGRAQGRCGFGALMGSKNLKAIAIKGSQKFEGQDTKAILDLRKKITTAQLADPVGALLPYVQSLFGTNSYMDMGMFIGDVPGFYFTETEFTAELLTEKSIKEKYPVFTVGCAGCTLKCGKQTVIQENGVDIKVDGPEYEAFAAFGPLSGVFDSGAVILSGHYANVYGFDVISGGVSIAFLIYLVQNNLAVKKIKTYLQDINIEEITWGNGVLVKKLVHKIAKREDIGNLLAEGVKIMAEKLEVNPELAAHTKGLEFAMHDPRAFAGQALNYMTCCIGASHEKADWFQTEIGGFNAPEWDIISGDRTNITGRERGVMHLQDLRSVDDSAVNCNFETPPKISDFSKYLTYATGTKYTAKTLMEAGERIFNIKRLISCSMGITRKDDKLPKIVTEVLQTGKTAGIKLDLEENLKSYYEYRGWDWETGRPTEKKLKQLWIIPGEGVRSIEKTTDDKIQKLTDDELQKLDKLKVKYLEKLKAKNILWEDMQEYLNFWALLANSDSDFYDEFETSDETIQFEIKKLSDDQWFWLQMDHGKFSSGSGKKEATLNFRFKNESIMAGLFSQSLDAQKLVLTGKLKIKPLGKAKLFANFIELYLSKLGMKL